MAPAPAQISRFVAALDALLPTRELLGVAVSGGPDSLALLLLASAARPDAIAVATVDHGLRPESADEATMVAQVCARLGVPHAVLTPGWAAAPTANIQAEARAARYRALGAWAKAQGLAAVATGHHVEDQAETLLLRLARGAGLSGLAGVRPAMRIEDGDLRLVRPLLDWRRAELAEIVAARGLLAIADRANMDPRYDRARMRAWLTSQSPFNPERLAAAAHHLREAAVALDWAEAELASHRLARTGAGFQLDPAGLPRELRRRLAVRALTALGAPAPPGPKLARLLDALEAGETSTLGGVQAQGGARWSFSPAPPRRPVHPPSS